MVLQCALVSGYTEISANVQKTVVYQRRVCDDALYKSMNFYFTLQA